MNQQSITLQITNAVKDKVEQYGNTKRTLRHLVLNYTEQCEDYNPFWSYGDCMQYAVDTVQKAYQELQINTPTN